MTKWNDCTGNTKAKILRTIMDMCIPKDLKMPIFLAIVFYRFCIDSLEVYEF